MRVRCIIIVSRRRGRLCLWIELLTLRRWSSLVGMSNFICNLALLFKVLWMLFRVIKALLDLGKIKIIKVKIGWLIFRDWIHMRNWRHFIMIILRMRLQIEIMGRGKCLGFLEFQSQKDLIKWFFNRIIAYSIIKEMLKVIFLGKIAIILFKETIYKNSKESQQWESLRLLTLWGII